MGNSRGHQWGDLTSVSGENSLALDTSKENVTDGRANRAPKRTRSLSTSRGHGAPSVRLAVGRCRRADMSTLGVGVATHRLDSEVNLRARPGKGLLPPRSRILPGGLGTRKSGAHLPDRRWWDAYFKNGPWLVRRYMVQPPSFDCYDGSGGSVGRMSSQRNVLERRTAARQRAGSAERPRLADSA